MIKHTLPFFLGMLIGLSLYGQSTKKIAFTIDDLPMAALEQDDSLLLAMNRDLISHLSEYDVPAIGFVNERKLYDNDGEVVPIRRQMLVDWVAAGLDLGNHTYSHPDYNNLTPEEFFEDITKGEKLTKSILSSYQKELRYFRHPFLHRGNMQSKVDSLVNFLSEKGYIEAPVTIDNSEYIFARAYEIALQTDEPQMADSIGNSYVAYMMEKVTYFENNAQELFGRPISHTLLIHDNFLNAHFLGKLLAALEKSGYEFISLTDALEDPAYRSEDTTSLSAGITWLHRWAITRGVDKSFYAGEPTCPQFVQDYAGITE